jgi:hypothetical protein
MAKQAYLRAIVSLAPSGHEESYYPALEIQKERATGRVDEEEETTDKHK